MSEQTQVQQVVNFLMLAVQDAGGEVTISIDDLEKGFPKGSGLHMEQDDEGNVTMTIRQPE